jgi:hypothetical protein
MYRIISAFAVIIAFMTGEGSEICCCWSRCSFYVITPTQPPMSPAHAPAASVAVVHQAVG